VIKHKVRWRIEGEYELTTDDNATPEAVLDEFHAIVGEADIIAPSEVDGYDVLEVDGKHVHTWADSIRDNEKLCTTCWAREPKWASS
jgi:hypothetical protein